MRPDMCRSYFQRHVRMSLGGIPRAVTGPPFGRVACVRRCLPPNASSGPGAGGHMRHYAMAFRISISAVVAGGSCGSP